MCVWIELFEWEENAINIKKMPGSKVSPKNNEEKGHLDIDMVY